MCGTLWWVHFNPQLHLKSEIMKSTSLAEVSLFRTKWTWPSWQRNPFYLIVGKDIDTRHKNKMLVIMMSRFRDVLRRPQPHHRSFELRIKPTQLLKHSCLSFSVRLRKKAESLCWAESRNYWQWMDNESFWCRCLWMYAGLGRTVSSKIRWLEWLRSWPQARMLIDKIEYLKL